MIDATDSSGPRTVLAFDFGLRNIGVATGQMITRTASELATVRARDGIPDWGAIDALIREWQPDVLLVGLPLGHGLMLSTARQTLEAIGAGEGPKRYLVTLGYAGWGSGQLENELAQNAWLSCPADVDILFDVPFDQRVNKAAATLGIDFRLMSKHAGHA